MGPLLDLSGSVLVRLLAEGEPHHVDSICTLEMCGENMGAGKNCSSPVQAPHIRDITSSFR